MSFFPYKITALFFSLLVISSCTHNNNNYVDQAVKETSEKHAKTASRKVQRRAVTPTVFIGVYDDSINKHMSGTSVYASPNHAGNTQNDYYTNLVNNYINQKSILKNNVNILLDHEYNNKKIQDRNIDDSISMALIRIDKSFNQWSTGFTGKAGRVNTVDLILSWVELGKGTGRETDIRGNNVAALEVLNTETVYVIKHEDIPLNGGPTGEQLYQKAFNSAIRQLMTKVEASRMKLTFDSSGSDIYYISLNKFYVHNEDQHNLFTRYVSSFCKQGSSSCNYNHTKKLVTNRLKTLMHATLSSDLDSINNREQVVFLPSETLVEFINNKWSEIITRYNKLVDMPQDTLLKPRFLHVVSCEKNENIIENNINIHGFLINGIFFKMDMSLNKKQDFMTYNSGVLAELSIPLDSGKYIPAPNPDKTTKKQRATAAKVKSFRVLNKRTGYNQFISYDTFEQVLKESISVLSKELSGLVNQSISNARNEVYSDRGCDL